MNAMRIFLVALVLLLCGPAQAGYQYDASEPIESTIGRFGAYTEQAGLRVQVDEWSEGTYALVDYRRLTGTPSRPQFDERDQVFPFLRVMLSFTALDQAEAIFQNQVDGAVSAIKAQGWTPSEPQDVLRKLAGKERKGKRIPWGGPGGLQGSIEVIELKHDGRIGVIVFTRRTGDDAEARHIAATLGALELRTPGPFDAMPVDLGGGLIVKLPAQHKRGQWRDTGSGAQALEVQTSRGILELQAVQGTSFSGADLVATQVQALEQQIEMSGGFWGFHSQSLAPVGCDLERCDVFTYRYSGVATVSAVTVFKKNRFTVMATYRCAQEQADFGAADWMAFLETFDFKDCEPWDQSDFHGRGFRTHVPRDFGSPYAARLEKNHAAMWWTVDLVNMPGKNAASGTPALRVDAVKNGNIAKVQEAVLEDLRRPLEESRKIEPGAALGLEAVERSLALESLGEKVRLQKVTGPTADLWIGTVEIPREDSGPRLYATMIGSGHAWLLNLPLLKLVVEETIPSDIDIVNVGPGRGKLPLDAVAVKIRPNQYRGVHLVFQNDDLRLTADSVNADDGWEVIAERRLAVSPFRRQVDEEAFEKEVINGITWYRASKGTIMDSTTYYYGTVADGKIYSIEVRVNAGKSFDLGREFLESIKPS